MEKHVASDEAGTAALATQHTALQRHQSSDSTGGLLVVTTVGFLPTRKRQLFRTHRTGLNPTPDVKAHLAILSKSDPLVNTIPYL
jgi:hypothetical protein